MGSNRRSGGREAKASTGGDNLNVGPDLIIKNAPTPMGRGGMRSPLAAGSSNVAPVPAPAAAPALASAPATVAPPVTVEGASQHPANSSQQRDVSKIAALEEISHNLPRAAPLSYGMYNSAASTRRRIVLVTLLMLTLVAIGYLAMDQNFRDQLLPTASRLKTESIAWMRHPIRKFHESKAPTAKPVTAAADAGVDAVPTRAANPKSFSGSQGCRKLLRFANNGGGSNIVLQLRVADCHSLNDDFANAEAAMQPLVARLEAATEAELNARLPASKSQPLAEAFLALITVYLKEGKVHEAGELLRNHCLRWTQSNTCVGKAQLFADRKLGGLGGGEGGIKEIFLPHGILAPAVDARLRLAGAQLATEDGLAVIADQRYAMALQAAPADAFSLRKQIYETQAIDLYTRGEKAKLSAVLSRALGDLRNTEPAARIKLKLLLDLVSSDNKAKTLRSILSREDATYRLRGDIDFVESIGMESIRAGLMEDYIRLLDRTRSFYGQKYHALDAVAKRLMLWEIRTTMAMGHYDQALIKIGTYEAAFKPDLYSHHLRGVAYLKSSADLHYQMLAASEFQVAMKQHKNWESLYALGVALLHGGRKNDVAAVVEDLGRFTTTPGQRYWVDMLRAETAIASSNYPTAQRIITTWKTAQPDYFVPRQLQLQLFEKQGKTAQLHAAQANLDDFGRTHIFATSFEGFASPIGYMALAKRPVD